MLVSEYLPGREYTVDVFRGKKGIVVIPRIREQVRTGITFSAKVDLRKDLITYSKKLAKKLDLNYCFGFQFKEDKNGNPMLLECNPRVQGTMIVSHFAGFSVIYHAVMEALGQTVKTKKISLKDGIMFKRYWGGISIERGRVKDAVRVLEAT